MKSGILVEISQATITGETVEKVPKQILGGDAEKNDLTECATINDLIIMKGHETPKNQALTILKGFPTVSEVLLNFNSEVSTLFLSMPNFLKIF